MEQRDLAHARKIAGVAFGTFLGVPDPSSFWEDQDLVKGRWLGRTGDGVVAEIDGVVAGSNLMANWGSFAFFGPLTIRPDLWNTGIAKALLAATMDVFDRWQVKDAGLFTFPHSVKHIGLYQKFGFWPRYLTAVMTKQPVANPSRLAIYAGEPEILGACRALTDNIHSGLDVSAEIQSVWTQKLGATVILWEGDTLDAFAVCHVGRDTEAGTNCCFAKFAAARDNSAFAELLKAIDTFAISRGVTEVEAGVNTARTHAYRHMLESGFRSQMQGVAMQKPNRPGFNREDAWVLDDWR
jgi:GNAT superfamily N-acetyltransferase